MSSVEVNSVDTVLLEKKADDIAARVASYFLPAEHLGDFGDDSRWRTLHSAALNGALKGLQVAEIVVRSSLEPADG